MLKYTAGRKTGCLKKEKKKEKGLPSISMSTETELELELEARNLEAFPSVLFAV